MKRLVVPIKGMHCRSCELLLEDKIGEVQGVKHVKVNYRKGEAEIGHGADIPSGEEIARAVKESGYEVGISGPAPWLSVSDEDYRNLGRAVLILGILYLAFRSLFGAGFNIDTKNVSMAMAVVVGLIAGVSTCMALVGGLVLGLSARHAELHPEATAWEKFRPHIYFNAGRVSGYAFFGGLLGLVGSVFQLSNNLLALLTLGVGAVMVLMGLKLIGISPRLKEGGLTLPAWIGRGLGLSQHQKEYSHSSSLLTGALTFFLPCGFTQAMQLYAVSTGSMTRGAAVMALFALGTAPALLGIGGLTSVIKGVAAKLFYAVVGLAVLIFGILNVGNGLVLAGFDPAALGTSQPGTAAVEQNGVQIVRMTQKAAGYVPNVFTIRKGVPVKWIVTSETTLSCAASLSVPSLRLFRQLQEGENVIEFTPTAVGSIPFSCSMGMYRGVFNVTDGTEGGAKVPTPTAYAATAPAAPSAGSCGSGGGGCGCGGGARPKAPVVGTVRPEAGVQRIASRDNYGLSPNEFTVKAGQPVEWTITPDAPPAGCMTAFVNRNLGIAVSQSYPGATVINFTPTQVGDYPVTCAMGMWRATIHVN